MDYFTSDLHFSHEKLVELRGFNSLDEMDDAILESINSKCTEEDNLYVVGDISCNAKKKRHIPYIAAIKPKIILIKGNHDNREKNGKLAYHQHLHEFHHDLIREFGQGNEKHFIHFYHFPLAHWYLQHRGTWHIHGHLHGAPSLTYGKVIDVGWDKYNGPVSYEFLKEYMRSCKIRANHHSGKFFED